MRYFIQFFKVHARDFLLVYYIIKYIIQLIDTNEGFITLTLALIYIYIYIFLFKFIIYSN